MNIEPDEVLHVLTVIVLRDGRVQGDLDDAVALFPRESTMMASQVHSIVDQAVTQMLIDASKGGDAADLLRPLKVAK